MTNRERIAANKALIASLEEREDERDEIWATSKLGTVRHLALLLMDSHKLTGWQFGFDKGQRRFGYCRYNRRTITLSAPLCFLNDMDRIKNTILHEIAHALTGPCRSRGRSNHHSAEWRATALAIGCDGRTCYSENNTVTVEKSFRGTCPNPECGKTVEKYRRNRSACFSCCRKYSGGQFDERFLLTWTKINDLNQK